MTSFHTNRWIDKDEADLGLFISLPSHRANRFSILHLQILFSSLYRFYLWLCRFIFPAHRFIPYHHENRFHRKM
ncbi:unnamed protein product [Cuscuta epithymum]|uniref:Uncharacterized protein n=1 Tax=Cuscuta epithymum TaxID=186058 RepID=A0AAV0DQ28_9ASTE|nr:unnamed protein product [Cuscuta epithymum]